MTKHEFAQQLTMRLIISRGPDLNRDDIEKSIITSAARIAKGAALIAETIAETNPDFFTDPIKLIKSK